MAQRNSIRKRLALAGSSSLVCAASTSATKLSQAKKASSRPPTEVARPGVDLADARALVVARGAGDAMAGQQLGDLLPGGRCAPAPARHCAVSVVRPLPAAPTGAYRHMQRLGDRWQPARFRQSTATCKAYGPFLGSPAFVKAGGFRRPWARAAASAGAPAASNARQVNHSSRGPASACCAWRGSSAGRRRYGYGNGTRAALPFGP